MPTLFNSHYHIYLQSKVLFPDEVIIQKESTARKEYDWAIRSIGNLTKMSHGIQLDGTTSFSDGTFVRLIECWNQDCGVSGYNHLKIESRNLTEEKKMINFIKKVVYKRFIGFSENYADAYFEVKCAMSDGTTETKYQSVQFGLFPEFTNSIPEFGILSENTKNPLDLSNKSFGEKVLIEDISETASYVWCDGDPKNMDIILSVPGVSDVKIDSQNRLNNSARYTIYLDPRFNRTVVEHVIELNLLEKSSRK